MANFASIKPLLDAMSTEELISAGEYISQQLDKKLRVSAEEADATSILAVKNSNATASQEMKDLHPAKPFPLLHLPRELRDEILSHGVQRPTPYPYLHFGSTKYNRFRVHPLLHTNRQLRSEAAEIFFSQHTFVFWGDRNFSKLSMLLSISNRIWNKFIKCVVLVPDGSLFRENPWDIYDSNWSARMSIERRKEAGLEEGVVWTAMRRAGLGREERWEVTGEVARSEDEPSIEMVIG